MSFPGHPRRGLVSYNLKHTTGDPKNNTAGLRGSVVRSVSMYDEEIQAKTSSKCRPARSKRADIISRALKSNNTQERDM